MKKVFIPFLLGVTLIGCSNQQVKEDKKPITETIIIKKGMLDALFIQNEYVPAFDNTQSIPIKMKISNNLFKQQKECFIEGFAKEKELPIISLSFNKLVCLTKDNKEVSSPIEVYSEIEGELLYKAGSFLSKMYNNKSYKDMRKENKVPVVELKTSEIELFLNTEIRTIKKENK